MVFHRTNSSHIIVINQNEDATLFELHLYVFDYEIGFLPSFTIVEKLIVDEFSARDSKDFVESPGYNLFNSGGFLEGDNFKDGKGEPISSLSQDVLFPYILGRTLEWLLQLRFLGELN